MAGNTFGVLFKVTTFGESHGKAIGAVMDGFPAGIAIDQDFIQQEMRRRRPGQSRLTTARNEEDQVEILSGVFEGKSTGSPIGLLLFNQDAKSRDYSHLEDKYRPSHADFTWEKKFGFRDYRGGGRASARETACRVAAGAFAKLALRSAGIHIQAFVSQVGSIILEKSYQEVNLELTEKSEVRCPDPATARQMEALILETKKQGDTIGGAITCIIKNCPVGLGEPVFDKLHADLGKAVLSINACKGFEYGSGFESIRMKGSVHNDKFVKEGDQIKTLSNYSGGVQGGISNGMDIYFRAAFKPVATILRPQGTVDHAGNQVSLEGKGRHDPCVVPRAVPIVEAMAAIVLLDHLLRSKVNQW